ncbi:MAG: hypothetical protein V5A88_04155 [Candidatus Thermoplasmatota archaeon]
MGIKVTLKEWIAILIMFSVFIAITGALITFYFDVPGPLLMMVVLVVVFIAFKLYQWNKEDTDEEENGEDELNQEE